jgi:hypothetical protein
MPIVRNQLMKQILRLSPVINLSTILEGNELVAFNVGPNAWVYLLMALKPLDYTIEQPGWATFPKTIGEQRQSYRVVALSGKQIVFAIDIENEPFNIHDIQPLNNDLLLICVRSFYRGPDDFEKNGRIYTRDGRFKREILLGDGVGPIQTTSEGVIWTGFFDEGIFGNYGWDDPVGHSGLIAWNTNGDKLYEFQPIEELDGMVDCYALNVESNENIWCYYYSEFPLVQIYNRQIQNYWHIPIAGSPAFAGSANHALFSGGYEDDSYTLFSLGTDHQVEEVAKIGLQDMNGKKLIVPRITGRANALYFISNEQLYQLNIEKVISGL